MNTYLGPGGIHEHVEHDARLHDWARTARPGEWPPDNPFRGASPPAVAYIPAILAVVAAITVVILVLVY